MKQTERYVKMVGVWGADLWSHVSEVVSIMGHGGGVNNMAVFVSEYVLNNSVGL